MWKRWMACVLAALALGGAAVAEGALCVNVPGLSAFVDAAGNDLIADSTFDAAFPVRDGALYAVGQKGAYRLVNASGELLGDQVFSMIHDEGNRLVFRADGLFGAMDGSGSVVLEPGWTQLTSDGAEGWLALSGDPLDERADEILHLDAGGEPCSTGVYTMSGLQPVTCGRMPFMGANGRYGAVDGAGDVVVRPEWRWIGPFEDGLAVAWGQEGAGLIDAEGNAVIAAEYDWLGRAPSMIVARAADRLDVFDPDGGARRFTLEGEGIEAALAGDCLWVVREGRCALYAPDGAILMEGGSGLRFFEGLRGRLIAVDGAWGEACQWLVDPDGSAASGRFQQLLPLCADRYVYLEMDGVEYYSEELGGLQRSWNYDSMRYGLMDGAGTPLTGADYTEILALGENRLLLVSEGRAQLADLNGTVLREWVTAEGEAPTGEAGA